MRADRQAEFTDFAQAASPRLLTLAWMLTSDGARAEDLVQEALTRVYVAWSRVRTETASAYARRVLVNLHTETWRRTRREVLAQEPPDRPATSHGEPGRHVDLVRALQQLPQRERQAVVLRHYADLSERDAAETMACSVGTVKSLTSRGLVKLRDQLDSETGTGGHHAHT